SASRLGQLCSMRVERSHNTVTVRLQGEFDLGCVERFEEGLDSALGRWTDGLIVDLHGLTFIDSAGLRTLVVLTGRANEDGLDYKLLCGGGAVRRILHETGLDGVLPVIGQSGAVPPSDSPI